MGIVKCKLINVEFQEIGKGFRLIGKVNLWPSQSTPVWICMIEQFLVQAFHVKLQQSSWNDLCCNPPQVKCTLVHALSLSTGCTALRGSRGVALAFQDHDTRREWGFSVTPRPLFTTVKNRVPVGGAPGPVWTVTENIAPTWIRFPYRPARSQSLYRLCYAAHIIPHNLSYLW